jgi:glyoxalase family protein
MSIEIHHIAAISGDLQKTISFYHNILGLNFIPKTSFFDGPKVCHFYWDKEIKNFITFYHCPGLINDCKAASPGGTISFSVCEDGVVYWENRLRRHSIPFQQTIDELEGTKAFRFCDPDGLHLKLVFTSAGKGADVHCHKSYDNHLIIGLYGIEITSIKVNPLKTLFTEQLKMSVQDRFLNGFRFFSEKKEGSIIDLNTNVPAKNVTNGSGRIHHVAIKIQNWTQYIELQNYFQQQNPNAIFKKRPDNFSSLYLWNDEDLMLEIVGQQPSIYDEAFFSLKQEGTFRTTKVNR